LEWCTVDDTPKTLRIAAELVERGADLERVSRQAYHSHSDAHVALLRHVYGSFEVTDGGRLAHFSLPASVKEAAGANRGDTEGLIDHVRAIASVVVAVLFEEAEDGSIRISMRSKTPKIDVNAVAKSFGGGGHAEAAGATLEPPVSHARELVLAALRERLNDLDS
jgi:Exopolyphosphatase-related proteins